MAKIVVADDVDYIRKSITKFLEAEGHECVMCENGREAKEKLADGGYDLLITDIMMPEVDGFELIEFVRQESEHNKEMPILAISGGSKTINSDMALTIIHDQVDKVLQKPFTKNDLLDSVAFILNKKD